MATFNLYDEIGSGGYGNVYKSARVIDGKAGEIIYAYSCPVSDTQKLRI